MGLRTKILLPLTLLSVILIGFLYGYWMPHSLENIRSEFQSATERHLDTVAEGLIPLLLGHQLDTVYENLNALKDKEQDWLAIELSDAQGMSIYPLTPSKPHIPTVGEIHVISKSIDYLGLHLGTLTVSADFSPKLKPLEHRHRELITAMMAVILAFLVSSWIVLERLVIRPVKALSAAAAALAENRFEGALPQGSNDEVGELVRRFAEMRNAILEFQTVLLDHSQVLKKSRDRLDEAQRMAHLGSWEFIPGDGHRTWSDEVYRILGFEPQAFPPAPEQLLERVYPADRPQVADAYQRFTQAQTLYNIGYRILRASDGQVRHIHERCERILDDGNQPGYRGTLHDITEIKQAEEALRRYKDQLEDTVQQRTAELLLARDAAQAANKAKSVFLANMSHELRTPLNAILGFSGLMRRDTQISDTQRANLDIINRSGEHLLTLINDVLEMAKIESGRLQLEIAPFDLSHLVHDVVDMMHQRAAEKGLRLLLELADGAPRYINGDEARLRQILVNLVGNAIKFSDQGGVTLRVGTRKNTHTHLMIEVEDTGCGIRPEDIQRLFEPFVQLAEGVAQRGTGLGLAITRQFVQLMHGEIGVESTPGRGSLFRVDIPVTLADAAQIAKPSTPASQEIVGLAAGQPRYRILIVEDQVENQLLLSRLMRDLGLEVDVAENGQQAVEHFQQWHPHLIWMDRRMPVMDGVEATKRIRGLPGGDTVKIVAVTASAFKQQQQEMLDAGMDDFVRKPYRFNEIYDALSRQLGVKYRYRTDTTDKASSPELDPEMLSRLPLSLRNRLKEVLLSLDDERIKAMIAEAGELVPQLSPVLVRLAADFDYPAILDALDSLPQVQAAPSFGA